MAINVGELKEKLKDWNSAKKEEAVHICEQLCYDLDLAKIPYRRTPDSEIEWVTKSRADFLSKKEQNNGK